MTMSLKERFRKFSHLTSEAVGSPTALGIAVTLVIVWLLTGPFFNYSDAWQLVINTGTTIITFFMVFLIQNAQNRDTKEIHIKLDELLKGVEGARTELVDLEDLSDAELEKLRDEYKEMHQKIVEKIGK